MINPAIGMKALAVFTSVAMSLSAAPFPGSSSEPDEGATVELADISATVQAQENSESLFKSTLSSNLPPIATTAPLPVQLPTLGALSVNKSGVVLKDPLGRDIALTKTEGEGTGEEFYSGTTKLGQKVEVQVIFETKAPTVVNPDTLGDPNDPIEEVPVSGDSVGYEVEVASTLATKASFSPILAVASTATTVTIAAPAETNVKDVISYDSSGLQIAQPASQTQNSYGSITISRSDANALLGIELEEDGETSGITVPLANAAAAKRNNWTEFYYTTFIPEKYAPIPSACKVTSGNYGVTKHGGNNRSWKNLNNAAAYESYKTVAGVKVDWARGKVYNIALVSASTGYNDAGTLKSKKQASTKGIKFYKPVRQTGYVSWSVEHYVANPLCPGAGAIRYSGNTKMYRSGAIKINYGRTQVPNHEMYARTNLKGKWSNINRLTRKDFKCLSVPCGNNNYKRTMNLPIR